MAAPESNAQNLPTEQIPLVTFTPETREIRIDGVGEDPQVHNVMTTVLTGHYSHRLSEIYVALGQGTFTLNEVKEVTGLSTDAITSHAGKMSKILPPEIFAYDDTKGSRSVWYGNFAIASRVLTEEEKIANMDAGQRAKAAAVEKRKNAVIEAEKDKTDIQEADHALITINGQRYYLPLTSSEAVIAVRTIQALPSTGISDSHGWSELNDLVAKTWSLMPLAERRLFTNSETELYAGGQIVRDHVQRAASQVAGPLNLLHRGMVGSVFSITEGLEIDVEIKDEPPITPYDPSKVKAVYPPGTEKHIVQQNTLSTVTEEELTKITTILDELLANRKLTQAQSLEVLDLVTDRRSKVLARRILADRYGSEAAETILESLDSSAYNALGSSNYHGARRQRTIRGDKGAGRVQQVGGRLQGGKTFRHMGEGQSTVTGRWYFGKRSE